MSAFRYFDSRISVFPTRGGNVVLALLDVGPSLFMALCTNLPFTYLLKAFSSCAMLDHTSCFVILVP